MTYRHLPHRHSRTHRPPLRDPNTVSELRLFPVIEPDGKVHVDSQLFERYDPASRAYREKVKAWGKVVDELEQRVTNPLAYPRSSYPLEGIWRHLLEVYGRLWNEGIVSAYADRVLNLVKQLAYEECAATEPALLRAHQTQQLRHILANKLTLPLTVLRELRAGKAVAPRMLQ